MPGRAGLKGRGRNLCERRFRRISCHVHSVSRVPGDTFERHGGQSAGGCDRAEDGGTDQVAVLLWMAPRRGFIRNDGDRCQRPHCLFASVSANPR